ncbi:hypothetical protein [Rhodococcus marinonascens]|uniref:hypothetical protein n=1 Tax=Rhodococcus marinonascens TaxID=38311 RepID=UPI001FE622D7|nr:hypothetical protein [Rhodococcus marinonascens]
MLICGDVPLPLPLGSISTSSAPSIPDKDHFDEVFSKLQVVPDPRLIVVGSDAALAATLTRLMRTERLHIELAYVAEYHSDATNTYRLSAGARGARTALKGTAERVPLIRDDAGIALVGCATVTGPSGGPLIGEAYADDTLLFSGTTAKIDITPTPQMPGLRASVEPRSRWLPRRWVEGRAVQLGSPAAVLTRDEVPHPRELVRSTFYRHDQEWLLVR